MKYSKLLKSALLVLAVSLGITFIKAGVSLAFNANNLMDDGVFNNTGTMSAGSIDSWLNSNFPNSCISANNGFSAPDPTGYSPSTGFTYGGPVSAGRVIYDAALAYGLNPQVLLATLQKEESLVDGSAGCSALRISASVGYGCPDGGTLYNYSNLNPAMYYLNGSPVNSISGTCVKYASDVGFAQQLIHASWLLKFGEQRSEGNTAWDVQATNYPQPGDSWDNSDDPLTCYGGPMTQGNFKRCSSDTSTTYFDGYTVIDGTSTHMDTGATAALYWYTPHFSGNQNFDSIFQSWFGSIYVPHYTWQPTQQSTYTDSSMTTPLDTTNLLPGQRFYALIKAQNTGSVTWQKGVPGQQVNVGTSHPMDRASDFCDSSWLNTYCNRAATTNETSVATGGIGTFGFWMTAPKQTGTYNEYFNLVMDGTSWMTNDPGLYWTMQVKQPSWQPVQQSAYTDSSMTTPVNPITDLLPNQRYYLVLVGKNNGPATWQKGVAGRQVNVGTSHPLDRVSGFCDSSWLNTYCNRAATTTESSVAPGANGTFGFWITTPSSPGTYNEYFNLVMDGTSWMNDPGLYWTLKVNPVQLSWQPTQQSTYTDSSMSTPANPLSLQKGQRYYLVFKAKNTGNATWQKGVAGRQVNVGTSHPMDRSSAFCDSSWLNPYCNRPATTNESTVAPGGTGTFGFYITAPSQTGTYNEYFNLVMDGTTWSSNDPGLYWTLIVN